MAPGVNGRCRQLILTPAALNFAQVTFTNTTKMVMVDLAGSEKFDSDFKDEGGKINASLLALGKVPTPVSRAPSAVLLRPRNTSPR